MSWGDPWSRAFEGVGRAFGNYYDNKARLQEKEEDRVYFEEAEKRKEAAAEKARQAREEAERNAGIVFEAFSPEGKLTTLTRGDLSGGATLPDWELDRQRQAQLAAQAEAEAKKREQEAKLGKYGAETEAARARAAASQASAGLSRVMAERTRAETENPERFRSGGRGGLAKPTPTPDDAVIETIQAAAQSMIQEEDADPEVIRSRLYGMFQPTLVDKALGKYKAPPIGALFNMNPLVDDLLRSDTYK